MIVADALRTGSKTLKSSLIDTPVMEAGVLLCHVLEKDKSFIYAYPEYVLKEEEWTRYIELLKQRAKGKPLQYIIGYQEFMSIKFMVTPAVLIPRADTEILVEAVIRKVNQEKVKNAHVLDIGCGSGCIAVSIARYVPDSKVTALDVSVEALQVAQTNAIHAQVTSQISFFQSDLFEVLEKKQGYDIIISNPPYIPECEIVHLQREVKEYEPYHALFGGIDGLDFYRRIIDQSPYYLKPGGFLAFEVGYNQAAIVTQLMQDTFHRIEIVKDLAGIERVVLGYCIS